MLTIAGMSQAFCPVIFRALSIQMLPWKGPPKQDYPNNIKVWCMGCAGANRKLTYWDCHTGEAIRELDASQTGPILSVAVHPEGDILACCGADKEVKLWLYNEGTCFATGRQHTGEVTRCTFTPDGKKLITADSHGALCFWEIEEALKHVQGRQNNSKAG